jgi:predicted CXXCH cytochrome family protein
LGDDLIDSETNSNLCLSCHNPAGQASNINFNYSYQANPIIPNNKGTSHRWDSGRGGHIVQGTLNTSYGKLKIKGYLKSFHPVTYNITITKSGDIGKASFYWEDGTGNNGTEILTKEVELSYGIKVSFINPEKVGMTTDDGTKLSLIDYTLRFEPDDFLLFDWIVVTPDYDFTYRKIANYYSSSGTLIVKEDKPFSKDTEPNRTYLLKNISPFKKGDKWSIYTLPGINSPLNPEMRRNVKDNNISCSTCHGIHEDIKANPDLLRPTLKDVADEGSKNHLKKFEAGWMKNQFAGFPVTIYYGDGEQKATTIINNDSENITFTIPLKRPVRVGDAFGIRYSGGNCKDCHSYLHQDIYKRGGKGSHPVGLRIPQNSSFNYNLSLPLENGMVECVTCHKVHNADSGGDPDGRLLRMKNNSFLCQSCHTYPDHYGKSCLDCHTPHFTFNIYTVKEMVNKRKVTFLENKKGTDYARSYKDPNGICNVCHDPKSHKNYNWEGGNGHERDKVCINCHSHENGFKVKEKDKL